MILKDRVALITGAASGIGRAGARFMAREGAHVVILDRDAQGGAEAAAEIRALGWRAESHAVDVTDDDALSSLISDVIQRLGRIDILHNNVGVTHMGVPVELDEETFRAVLDLNVGSVYRTAKALLPHMVERGGGAIVNISSLAAIRYVGYPYFAYYAAKAAVNQATVALAMQYARKGVRANCIMPGLIDTPMIYRQISGQYASVAEMVAARNAMVPMGRMGTAFDVAAAAVFLASDEARFITGVCLPVDGGQSCAVGPVSPS